MTTQLQHFPHETLAMSEVAPSRPRSVSSGISNPATGRSGASSPLLQVLGPRDDPPPEPRRHPPEPILPPPQPRPEELVPPPVPPPTPPPPPTPRRTPRPPPPPRRL